MIKKDSKKTSWILASVIALLMITSVFGIIVGRNDNTNSRKYNGFEFFESENGWLVEVDGKTYAFDFLPSEVENISFEAFQINSSKVYLVYDSREYNANLEYSLIKIRTFLKGFGIITIFACSEEDKCPDNTWPLVSCDNDYNVIKFSIDNEIITFINDKCIALQGDQEALVKEADKLMYYWLGVIND